MLSKFSVLKISLFILLIVPAYAGMPSLSQAANTESINRQIDTIRRERESLVAEQQRLQAELDKTTREGQSLGTVLKSLDATRNKLLTDIKITQSKIAQADLNIQELESNMTTAERQIEAHRTAIGSALQTLSNYDKRPLALDFLASQNFSDIWRDRTELQGLSTSLEGEVASLRVAKTNLMIEKEKNEKKKAEILFLKKELDGQKVVVEESKKAKEKLLAETKNKEALYAQMLTENLRRQKEFEEDLYKLESELRITLDPTLVPAKRPGLLSWPLDNVYITQRFGKTAGAERLYASGSHNGVDFRASQSTPVKAMLSGRVLGSDNTDDERGCGSYGRWVLVEHGNGLTSVYAHLSGSLVKNGETIATGQVIGYSGGTPGYSGSGYSTGPHLHVGLFASQGVEVRLFTQSRGCKNSYVPIADVRAYLDPLAYLPQI
ncbi:MAG TPA: peptidoglycan DD-metalloendopeptidase family protein [Candidatus Paceibacterota bacterium]